MKFTNQIFCLFLVVSVLSSCSKSESSEVPVCIQDRLDIFQTEQANCSNASLKKYTYQEIEVFAFEDGDCLSDGGVLVVDDGCGEICFLGGIAGFTECNGEIFEAGATLLETIWESN